MKTSLSFGILVLLLPLLGAAQSGGSQQRFDHLTTGFELTGKHREAACESCHVSAVFKGTPRECSSCHAKGTRINALP
jgi:hypothetical protein